MKISNPLQKELRQLTKIVTKMVVMMTMIKWKVGENPQ